MASLTVQLGRVKAANTRIAQYAKNLDDTGSTEAFMLRLEKLEDNWTEFFSILDQINSSDQPFDEATTESMVVEFENRYFNTREVLTRSLRTYQADANNTIDDSQSTQKLVDSQSKFLDTLSKLNIQTSETQLPKISIKPFSGDYCDWKSFHDLFVSSVHNSKKLTASQKFHYLKSFLVNEPATLLKHIAITDDNYAEAWDKLTTRYNKLGRIAYSFVSKFMQLPSIIQPNANDLRPFTDSVDEILRGLRALDPKAESRDVWLIHILLNKLDESTQQTWAEYILSSPNIKDAEFPTIVEFTTFLEHRCSSLEVNHRVTKSKLNNRSFSSQNNSRSSHQNNRPQSTSKSNQFKAFQASNLNCPKCKSNHTLSTCQQFLNLAIPDRRSFICSQNLCLNCLRSGHKSSTCKSTFNCRKCHNRHHTLIHPISSDNTIKSSDHQTSSIANSTQLPATMSSLPGPSHLVNHYSTQTVAQRSVILLPTVLAYVIDASGQKQTCRILLDSGSQVSFISEACIKRLGLPRQHARIPVSGLASFEAGTTKGLVNIRLLSRINGQFINVNSYILKTITSNLPTNTFNLDKFEIYQSLSLADPNFNVASAVDILLGADQFFKVLRNNSIVGVDGNPDALLTMFGWVIGGDISNFEPYFDNENSLSHTVVSLHTSHDIDVALQRFWEMEEVQSSPIMTSDERRTDEHFISTHTRAVDGKYVLELPFKTDNTIDFGNSLNAAIRRQKSMERKFMSNQQLHESYAQFMTEYLQMGHMTRLHTPHISSTDCYYLPHHAVFKADSTTTKLRVVFDGSSKHGINTSLNENLLVGPPIQRELFSTCIRFRRHQYALTGDIEKMFRQIWIAEKHRSFQRIIWRSSAAEPLQHFELNTVTYGTSCAPYLSVRVLKQLALDNIDQFPKIAQIILNDFYVDDVMTGADTIDNLFDIKTQLSSLLQSAGFPLRKWSTNCWPLLASIPDDQRELSPLELSDDTSIKVLGLRWYPTRDCFSYKVSLPDHVDITKRNILSDASRIFDPLGFLAPSVIIIKILFQQLWLLNLQWDDVVPDDVRKQWSTLRNEVQFEKVTITRRIWQSNSDLQFHAFCDASEKAFSAVVYCRSSYNDRVQIELVAAKTKVAPLKQISLPRLELCGAVLLCKLINQLKLSLQIPNMNIYAWTDSQIVLHWLSSPPRRWSTFIGNRTSQILAELPRRHWNHVRSASNPADCASRGLLPAALIDFDLWWHGPKWLINDSNVWPSTKTPDISLISSTEIEERSTKQFHVTLNDYSHFINSLLLRKSSWTKIIRIVAYVHRFVNRLRKNRSTLESNVLQAEELASSKLFIIKQVQCQAFGTDIATLDRQAILPKSSNIVSLSPFIDTSRILRVGGRIEHSTLSYSTRHPIILPKGHRLTFLIAQHYHYQHLHAGVAQMFFLLRQEYWIIGCRTLLRKIVHDCVPCLKQRQSSNQQYMADLPKSRITYSRPFSRTGCDYAGPITLRLSRGRNPKFTKAYIALFVCFVTKALHLELVGDLSTTAFIAALHRFVARRGKPAEIISDNGTNFIGAKRQMNEMFQLILSEHHQTAIAEHLSQDGITWKNTPPHAPHHGGLWEAGVRSVKLHLRRVIGQHILTYEEMYTLLTRIEALLNSRPLCPSSDSEIDALTPAHFIIGHPFTSIPEPDISNQRVSLLTNWELLTNLTQGFWNRWHKEYLTSLQQRSKWQHQSPDLATNDLVLIKEPRLPPSKWIVGRIQECHPSSDGHIRVATVKTTAGIYVRPITKLIPLLHSERTGSFSGRQDVLD